jgi:hypothetical protein
MNDEAARQGRSEADQLFRRSETSTAARGQPSVEEIVAHCREVAAATGFAWLHDLAAAEVERMNRELAA